MGDPPARAGVFASKMVMMRDEKIFYLFSVCLSCITMLRSVAVTKI